MSRSDLVLVPACLFVLVWSVLALGGTNYPLNGYYEVRSPEGGLLQYRFFKNGKKEGEHLGWWPDGKPRFLYHFKEGKYDGPQVTWTPEGVMATLNHYQMGREEGLQRAWTGDGVMTFNYTVKDGRIYGYRGTKECGRQRKP